MRTEKKLLNKEALRTIKGGFTFVFPAQINTFGAGGGDEPSTEGGFTDANSEEDDVINVGSGTPASSQAPPSLLKAPSF